MARKALGKGIEALIPSGDAKGEVRTVPIKLIASNPYQPRKLSGQEVEELSKSIEEHGVLQPVVLRRKGQSYELVAGSRRLKAAQVAGLKEIPAVIREADEHQMLALALVENLQREDLNPIEAALAYHELKDKFSMSQAEIAKAVGKDRSTVTNTMRLLSLPRKVRRSLEQGMITEGHARALLGVTSPTLAEKLCIRIINQGLSVRDAEKLVQRTKTSGSPAKKRRPDGTTIAAAELIAEKLGVKVTITRGKRGGRIQLRFADEKELDRLLGWFSKR